METQKITVALRDPMQAIRQACGHETASHSFASLFLWQQDMDLSVCLRERAFAVRCGHWGDDCWFFPCGERDAVLDLVEDILDSSPKARFLYLRQGDADLLTQHFPGRFRLESAEDASEYLYDRREYMTLPGSRHQHIRWCLNHLKHHCELRTELLSDVNMDVARDMLDRWEPCSETDYFANDHATAKMMLGNMADLDMTGVIVYVDGEAAALAAGFPLSDRVYDIAFSKALERERGLQFYVRRALIERLPERYEFINGEEDLGIPGLRQSKLQENPIGRIEMFCAYAS